MKKVILFLFLIVGILGFSASFSGDGKYHANELTGSYKGEYENIIIKSEKGKLVFSYNDGSKGYFKPVGNGLYVAHYTLNTNYHGYGTMEMYFA